VKCNNFLRDSSQNQLPTVPFIEILSRFRHFSSFCFINKIFGDKVFVVKKIYSDFSFFSASYCYLSVIQLFPHTFVLSNSKFILGVFLLTISFLYRLSIDFFPFPFFEKKILLKFVIVKFVRLGLFGKIICISSA
jgi:hypothetical protein